MPSSLLPSRCALSSFSISSSSFDLVSSRCSCALSRNFLRLAAAAFLGMARRLLHFFLARGICAGHASAQIIGQGFLDSNVHKLAGQRVSFEKYRAVDFGGL